MSKALRDRAAASRDRRIPSSRLRWNDRATRCRRGELRHPAGGLGAPRGYSCRRRHRGSEMDCQASVHPRKTHEDGRPEPAAGAPRRSDRPPSTIARRQIARNRHRAAAPNCADRLWPWQSLAIRRQQLHAGKSLFADRQRLPRSKESYQNAAARQFKNLTVSNSRRECRKKTCDFGHQSWHEDCSYLSGFMFAGGKVSGVTERTPMSKLSTHELDLETQLSLVAKIRHAAQRYKAAPAESGSAALQAYIAAVECLAQHIEDRCDRTRMARTIPMPIHRPRAGHAAKARSTSRVIPFPAASASPITAA